MANDEFRDQQQAARAHGLEARHETRVERAIRRAVAEEIAQAIENNHGWQTPEQQKALDFAAQIARNIGYPKAPEETS